jgi:ectoine hydroxylase-related dioxygenase (phytanoyl-CoA dioxygenase family)
VKKTVVLGFLGTQLDSNAGANRWERWRPTIALLQREDLLCPRDEAFFARHHSNSYTFVDQHVQFAALANLAKDSRLRQIARSTLDPAAQMYMSLVQCNQGGQQQGIAWHQDIHPSLGAGNMLNCLLYPYATTKASGGLRLVPGSHLLGALPAGEPFAELPGEITVYPQAGDLLIVDALCFHCVPVNSSAQRRVSLNFRYKTAKQDARFSQGAYRTGLFDYATGQDLAA